MNSSEFLISVIVPNYNHSKFLEARLASIINQTYQNFEIILLDDASTDHSLKILKKYENHPKVSCLVENIENSGNPFKQWKKGIEIARGDYIWVAESDDSCSNIFLETLVKRIKQQTALVFCDTWIIDSDGKKIQQSTWAASLDDKKWTSGYVNSGKDEIEKYLKYKNCIPNASAVIFNKSLANQIKYPEQMFYCGDWYIWIQLCNLGDISFSNKSLNYFREHEATTRVAKDFRKELKRYKEYNFIIKNNSTFKERFVNREKYRWMIDEWLQKSKNLKWWESIKIVMPSPLYFIYLKRYLIHKLIQKQ